MSLQRIAFAAVVAVTALVFSGFRMEKQALAGDIPLIDAHSQVDCNVSKDLVLGQIERLRISRVLISIRGCKGWAPQDIEARSLEWAKDYPDHISALLSTKVNGWAFNSLEDSAIEAFEERSRRQGFVGMGEVLVQHAAHDHAYLKYPELALSLDDRRIKAAIAVARAKRWPVILHIELNDNEEHAAQTLIDLERLLDKYPDTPFVLIHMGQASADEARNLLAKHRNIYFLTTTADDFAAFSVKKARANGVIAEKGWINLFEGKCELQDCPSAWKPEWKKLIVEFPSHFVLAFENVFPQHWEKPYAIKVGIWRRALAKLPGAVAHAIAHRNAERLWNLPPVK